MRGFFRYISQVKVVAHPVSLGAQVFYVIPVRLDLYWHVLHYLKSIGFEAHTLGRVVGHQSHLVHAEVTQHLRATAIVALVGLESEVDVSVHGVEAVFLLQLIGGNLVHQAYAATLLLHVYHNALALFLYHLHRLVELLTAIAPHASEYVARGARRVYSDEDRLVFFPFTFHQRHVLQSVARLAERYEMEMAVYCRQVNLLAHLDARLVFQAIGDEVLDAYYLHVPLFRPLLQLWHAGRRSLSPSARQPGAFR